MKRTIFLISLILLLLLVPGGATAADTPAPTLVSITPLTGETNTTVTITSLAGTNFASGAGMRLKGSASSYIVGSITSMNSSIIAGTFNLDNQAAGDYQVCVYNNITSFTCGLRFTITAPSEAIATGSIFFESNPPGATVNLNGTQVGTTVFTYTNATPGTYKVLIRKSGYEDATGIVTVSEGKRVRYYAQLTPLGAGTVAATATPVPTATTIRKSTLKVPTTWPSSTTTTTSPVDPAIVIGAVGLGLVMIRRR
jgi:hypothetical protein